MQKRIPERWIPPPVWEFDENVARIFDQHVRQSVPFYEEIHRLVTELATRSVIPHSTVCDVGTSTGEAIWRLHKRLGDKSISYLGIDASPAMIAVARQRLAQASNVTLVQAKVQDVCLPPTAVCLCVLTLGFIASTERGTVLTQLHSSLQPRGRLILVEKVESDNIEFREACEWCLEDFKLRNGLTLDEVAAKRDSIRGVLIPLALNQNIALLKQAGFEAVDVFFAWMNFVGLTALASS